MTAMLGFLVLLYGTLLTIGFAGGCTSNKERHGVAVLSVILLALQALSYYLFGLENTRKLYPLITHLPTFVVLVSCLNGRGE